MGWGAIIVWLMFASLLVVVGAAIVSAEQQRRLLADAGDGEALFEVNLGPRRMWGSLWALVALGTLFFTAVAGALQFGNVLSALACGLLALRQWNVVGLRITQSTLIHLPPNWMALAAPKAAAITLGGRIAAADVAGADWVGYDNIGIRLKDGRVESVFFRDRIPRDQQVAAREAVLAFIERATGKPVEREPKPEAAPWMRDASA